MDFLNKAFAQLSDLFRSMTPGARITAGLLLAVVVISVAYLFNQRISGSDAYLLEGQSFTSADMAAMQGAFGKAGLSDFTVEGNRVRIPSGQQAVYLAALADAGALPSNFATYMMDAASKTGPFTNREQQKDIMKGAKMNLLTAMIRGMDGVEDALVVYDSEKKGGLRPEKISTALVTVKLKGGRPLSEERVPDFQRAVAAGIAGLSPEEVAVTDQKSGRTFGGRGADGTSNTSENRYLASMKKYKTEYEESIRKALEYVPGVTVSANVVLNTELRNHQEKVTVDPKAVVISSQDRSTNSTTKGPEPNGRPGLQNQGGVPNAGAALAGGGKGSESTEETSESQLQNVVSHGRSDIEMAPLTPNRVNVAVGVPSSYFESIWRERNPTPAGEEPKPIDDAAKAAIAQIQTEEIAKITKHILGQVPLPAEAGIDPTTLITVTPFTTIAAPELSGPSITDKALSWAGAYWSTAGMIGLALVSLLMLRSMIRSGPPVPETAAGPVRVASEPAAEEAEPVEAPKSRFKRKLGTGPSLRDELADIVREDPDAAANILRSWIGNVS
jgi:flagellar M-ring protein FliF